MSIAELAPVQMLTVLAIPPLENYKDIPKANFQQMRDNGITDIHLKKVWDEFIKRCKEDYYVQWFWFPYRDYCWVNTWKSACNRCRSIFLLCTDWRFSERAVAPQDVDIKTYRGDSFTGVKAQGVGSSNFGIRLTLVWLVSQFQATVAEDLSELVMDWKCFNSVTGYMQASTPFGRIPSSS